MPSLQLPRFLVGLVLGSLLLAVSCSQPERPIRIGVLVWPPYELFFLAREQVDSFPDEAIELVEYRSPIDVSRAYENGALDAVLTTADFALRIAGRHPDSRIALVLDYSNGADVILARPEIDGVEGLAGRRVGLELSSLGLYLLQRGLGLAAMTLADVELVSVDYPELPGAYHEGRVDAVVIFEPARSRLLEAGARQIFDSSEIPGEIVDVMVVRSAVLESRTAELRSLVDSWFEARDLLNRQPQRAASVMSARQDLSPDELLAALSLVVIPSRAANRQLLGEENSELDAALQRLASTMRDLQLLRTPSDPGQILDDRLVREAE